MKKLFLIMILILCLQVPVCAADYWSYIITNDDKYRLSDVYVYDSYYIFVPNNLDIKKQLITKDMLKEKFEKVPLKLRIGIKYIILLDFDSEQEIQLKEKYGESYNIFAIYYENNIFFYQNDNFDKNLVEDIDENGTFVVKMVGIDKMLEKNIYHECAHHYDSINKTSDAKEWQSIVDTDKIKLCLEDVSTYREEFAESVSCYYTRDRFLKNQCPERYEFISKLLK